MTEIDFFFCVIAPLVALCYGIGLVGEHRAYQRWRREHRAWQRNVAIEIGRRRKSFAPDNESYGGTD